MDRWQHLRETIGPDPNLPSLGRGVTARLHDAVVVGADQHQIAQCGGPAGPPGKDVVGVAGVRWLVAAGEHTAAVALLERHSDGWSGKTLGAAHVEDLGVTTEHDREDVGIAEPTS